MNYDNIDRIRTLRPQGAGLEWIDKEGKTPLMVASVHPDLLNVARVLTEFGANVNAYPPGSHARTTVHHAANKGLEQNVHLLLSHGDLILLYQMMIAILHFNCREKRAM